MFSLFSAKKRHHKRAQKKELAGELEAAAQLYVEAELFDDAARVLLMRADAEPSADKRMVLCAQAARAGDGTEHGRQALRRKALLGYDLVKATRGVGMRQELIRTAEELERAGEWRAAAEAYVLAEDPESEIRVLRDAGAIEELEDRLTESSEKARLERGRADLVRRIRDLDTIGERREALKAGRRWLEARADEQIQFEIDRIAARLVTGRAVMLEIHGKPARYVLGSHVTIGRAQADIVVASSSVSRQHLEVIRQGDMPHVVDLDTRNGTFVAGARISAPLPIGRGIELTLGDQVPITFTPTGPPERSPVEVAVAEARFILPLGPLSVEGWQIVDAHDGDDRFVVLRTPGGTEPPHMSGFRLGQQIELAVGDRLSATRGGPVVLAVPQQLGEAR